MLLIYKVLFNKDRCKGCTLCVISCPKKIISMSDQLNEMGYYVSQILEENEKDCIGCGCCFRMCPDSVISIVKVEENEKIENIN